MSTTTELLQKVIVFLIGEPHNMMYTAVTFIGINLVLDFVRRYEPPKDVRTLLTEMMKRTLAYLAFLIIATRVDSLAMDTLFGWEGSTQYLVCLYIMAREIRVIFDYIRSQGIEIPAILDSRINQMTGQSSGTSGADTMSMSVAEVIPLPVAETDAASIDAKIEHLREQLTHIESLRANRDTTNNGGDAQ